MEISQYDGSRHPELAVGCGRNPEYKPLLITLGYRKRNLSFCSPKTTELYERHWYKLGRLHVGELGGGYRVNPRWKRRLNSLSIDIREFSYDQRKLNMKDMN